MGIRQLEKFMKENVPDGFIDFSIEDECRKYQSDNDGEKPTIVLDLMSLTSLINRDKVETLYGGRSGKCFKMIDSLFKRLSNVANLVFYSDGAVVPTKYDTWIERQDEKYPKLLQVIDLIYSEVPVAEIVNRFENHDLPRINNNSRIIKRLAKSYGTLLTAITTECDAEIAKYAFENPSVIAVLSDDSDFLIFRGEWRYLSVRELILDTLVTKEFSRTALRKYLRLNDSQLMILATIAGNDIVKYEEVKRVHGRNFGHQAAVKFLAIAKMIRFEISKDSYEDMLYNLADFLLNDESDLAVKKIHQSINQYNVDFELSNGIDGSENSPLIQYCNQNRYNFVARILQGLSKNLSFDYQDFRRDDWPDFGVIRRVIFERIFGVILKHRQPSVKQEQIFVSVYTKLSHDRGYQNISATPNYPPFEIPPLLQLLDSPSYPEWDNVRFKLLTWTVSETLRDFNLCEIHCHYLLNVLSLYLMVEEKFITIQEADLILLSVKNVELETIPDDLVFPPVVSERAFRIVFLFFKFFSTVGQAMKTVGLRHLRHPTNFDGVFFHKTYLNFIDSGRDPLPLLKDIDQYRIYKNL